MRIRRFAGMTLRLCAVAAAGVLAVGAHAAGGKPTGATARVEREVVAALAQHQLSGGLPQICFPPFARSASPNAMMQEYIGYYEGPQWQVRYIRPDAGYKRLVAQYMHRPVEAASDKLSLGPEDLTGQQMTARWDSAETCKATQNIILLSRPLVFGRTAFVRRTYIAEGTVFTSTLVFRRKKAGWKFFWMGPDAIEPCGKACAPPRGFAVPERAHLDERMLIVTSNLHRAGQ